MLDLLLASSNPGKLREISSLIGDLEIRLITPNQLNLQISLEENGASYAENAFLKAQAYCRATKLLTLADDTGLEVEALGGMPGLRSARFSPKRDATDADRRAYLLEQLTGKPRPWKARFRCVVAVAIPESRSHFFEGDCQGEIIPDERGENGFGYDPIFLVQGTGRTMAELTMEEKNQVSHRAKAVRASRELFQKLLSSG